MDSEKQSGGVGTNYEYIIKYAGLCWNLTSYLTSDCEYPWGDSKPSVIPGNILSLACST
jgi:hypothetical protein